MIGYKEIDDALGAVVSAALREAELPAMRVRDDVRKPLPRPSYRIDLTVSDDTRTSDYAERGAEVEIYYYPKDTDAPQRELLVAADALRAALGEGVDVAGFRLFTAEEIGSDAGDDVLAVTLRLEWIETAEEPVGEMMEELEYDG